MAISDETRVRVWLRDGFCCVRCGSQDRLTLDHVVPRSSGGTADPANLQTLCRGCNIRKGGRRHTPGAYTVSVTVAPKPRRQTRSAPVSKQDIGPIGSPVMNETLPLQRVRELAGLSRRVAALRLDVTETTVQRWERGRMPPVHRLRQLGALYGLTLDQTAAAIEVSVRRDVGQAPTITAAGDSP